MTTKKKITSPANHDSFFRSSMQHIDVARAFFEAHVPAHIRKRIDFESLKIEPNSYIDKEHKQVISDILYSVQIDNDLGYLYILAEHVRHEVAQLKSMINMVRWCQHLIAKSTMQFKQLNCVKRGLKPN